jgi:hypothetical protein
MSIGFHEGQQAGERRTAVVRKAPVSAPEPAQANGTGRAAQLLGGVLSDYKALVTLAGVLVYGLVRVAYDAFYTRLGVFPEAVGLSETTILGRAALYLAITVSIAVVGAGAWLLAVAGEERRAGAHGRTAAPRRRLLVAALGLTLVSGALVAAAGEVRSLLGSLRLVYYCDQRCKFNVLNAESLHQIRMDIAHESVTQDFSVTVLGGAWLVLLPFALLVAASVLGLVWSRRAWPARRAPRAALLLAAFGAASVAAGFAAPLIAKVCAAAKQVAAAGHDGAFLDVHADALRWVVLVLALVAVALGLLAAVGTIIGPHPQRSPWLYGSFAVLVPLLLGLCEPQVPLFVLEQGGVAVAAAVVLVGALVSLSFVLAIHRSTRPGWSTPTLAGIVAAIVWLALFLAWERGLNLGNQAAIGDQIYPQRFSLLSVRSSVVCLRPVKDGARPPRTPFVYLGESGDTLVLYDYRRDLRSDIPSAFPVRMPASDVDLTLALYTGSAWACGHATR